MNRKIVRRLLDEDDAECLKEIHPVLRRIYLARNVRSEDDLDYSLTRLPSPWLLSGMELMVQQLVEAIQSSRRIMIIADYDADGATSCAVAKLGLQLFGAEHVSYVVPDRFRYGYGLTPEIVALASEQNPDVILTVDNGISSIEGVIAAHERGVQVLITDHHLPGERLPEADAIVNPNVPGDLFPGKALAGVGVMFYVLMALRARLREAGWFGRRGIDEPNLGQLLDLVALGTVADVVPLDRINRILVHQGLLRIRSGQLRVGLAAILEVANRAHDSIVAADLGFAVGPRLNAAGRLDDMSLGIECLLSEEIERARTLAAELDAMNRERRQIEEQMKAEALALLNELEPPDKEQALFGVCLFDDSWHQGVIGIVASRIKDRLQRPVIAFAPAADGEIKGSARSIPEVHIRDVLSEVAAAHPDLLNKFGGHAMAAGMSLRLADYPAFALAFDAAVKARLTGVDVDRAIYTDGRLDERVLGLDFAEQLGRAGPWGQGFPEPVFEGRFDVVHTRVVGQKHVKFVLRLPGISGVIDAIAFFVERPESWVGSSRINVAYRLAVNEFRNVRGAQLVIEAMDRCVA